MSAPLSLVPDRAPCACSHHAHSSSGCMWCSCRVYLPAPTPAEPVTWGEAVRLIERALTVVQIPTAWAQDKHRLELVREIKGFLARYVQAGGQK